MLNKSNFQGVMRLIRNAGIVMTLGISANVFASGADLVLDKAPDRSNDMAALQRGAQLFSNYCLNCHGAQSMRYNRLKDLGLTDVQIKDNLLLTNSKIGDTMKVALTPADGKEWLGASPPDLSVIARAKGVDWLYTYLRTYYRDPARPTGWNNQASPNVAMPNVLWELQGTQIQKEVVTKIGEHEHTHHALEVTTPGKLNAAEFDSAVADLVNYLAYMGEPHQQQRKQIGVFVLLGLMVFAVIAWCLNQAYWKNIK
jgi:ubiquinol-cytochrome c reductase cytochrome c1 subunit